MKESHPEASIHAALTVVLQLAAIGSIGGLHRPSPDARSRALLADSLYLAGNLAASISTCDSDGTDVAPLHWRAARSFIAIGMSLPDDNRRRASYDSALTHAQRALRLAPADNDARYWVAAAAGRRAHRRDPIYSSRLARDVYDQATTILAADSLHAGAHHALGKLHAEVLKLPSAVRFIVARTGGGDAVRRANAAESERHLRRAVELEPQMIQFLVDLGDLYLAVGRTHDAAEIARRAARLPSRFPIDDALRAAFLARFPSTIRDQ